MEIYHIPAMTDHIMEQTKQKKIFMATHSQGTTAFFAIASDRPGYQEKLTAVFPMAPAVFISILFFRYWAVMLKISMHISKINFNVTNNY